MGAALYGYLITLLFWIPLTVLFLRIAFQLIRAPFSDPVVGWVYSVLNPILRPFERVIPRWRNLSLAAVLLFVLVASIEYALLTLRGHPGQWLLGGIGGAISFSLGFLIVAIVLYALFSLFEPRRGASIVYLVQRIADPLCGMFRRYIPMIGPFDLSPMFATLALVLLRLTLPTLFYHWAAG